MLNFLNKYLIGKQWPIRFIPIFMPQTYNGKIYSNKATVPTRCFRLFYKAVWHGWKYPYAPGLKTRQIILWKREKYGWATNLRWNVMTIFTCLWQKNCNNLLKAWSKTNGKPVCLLILPYCKPMQH